MKPVSIFIGVFLVMFAPCHRAFLCAEQFTYQNYNHGYCPQCRCAPCCCGNPPKAPCDVPMPNGACAPCNNAPACAPCNQPCNTPCNTASSCNTCEAPCDAPCEKKDDCCDDKEDDCCDDKKACCLPICAIGIGLAAIAAAAAIIVSSGNGSYNH